MNANPNISFESTLKSAAKDRRTRLGVFASNRVNLSSSLSLDADPMVTTPQLIDPNTLSKKELTIWKVMTNQEMPLFQYLEGLIYLSGYSRDEIKGNRQFRHIAMCRRSISRSIHAKYPNVSICRIAKMLNRDQTTIRFHLDLIKTKINPNKHQCYINSVPKEYHAEIIRRHANGETQRELAKVFNTSQDSIGRIWRKSLTRKIMFSGG